MITIFIKKSSQFSTIFYQNKQPPMIGCHFAIQLAVRRITKLSLSAGLQALENACRRGGKTQTAFPWLLPK